jgi:hypothetical protein
LPKGEVSKQKNTTITIDIDEVMQGDARIVASGLFAKTLDVHPGLRIVTSKSYTKKKK